MAHSCYVTLPSDSFLLLYSDNTVIRYRVKLAQPLSLGGQWEVGVAEIIFILNSGTLQRWQQGVSIFVHNKRSQAVAPTRWTRVLQDTKEILDLLETNYLDEIQYL